MSSVCVFISSDCLSLQSEKQPEVVTETNGKHTTTTTTKGLPETDVDSDRLEGTLKSGEAKKVQKLNKDLTKQNSQLLKFVETLKREKDSLQAEKQKLKSENKSHEKELKKTTSALDSAHSELNRLRHQLVKRGSSTSSLGGVRAEKPAAQLQLEERIQQLEAQLAEKEAMMEDAQTQLVEREASWSTGGQLQQDGGGLHGKEGWEHTRENGAVTGASHVTLDRLLEEQDISTRLQQQNSELKTKITLMQAELEQLQRNSSDVFQESTKARRISPAGFFRKGRKHSSEHKRVHSTSEEHDNKRSISPDIMVVSDSAHDLCSPKSPQHQGVYARRFSSSQSPTAKSPSISPRRTRSASTMQGETSTLQTCLKLALDEKHTLEEQKATLERDLQDARNQIKDMQQSVLTESQKVTRELGELKHTLEVALNEKTTFSERVSSLEKEIAAYQANNKEMTRTIEEMVQKMKDKEQQHETTRLEMSQKLERVQQENSKLRKKIEGQNEQIKQEVEMKCSDQVRELGVEKENLKKQLVRTKSTEAAAASQPLTSISKSVSTKTAVRKFSSGSYGMDESGKPPPQKSALPTCTPPTSPKRSSYGPRRQPDELAESAQPLTTSPKHSSRKTSERGVGSALFPPVSPKRSSTSAPTREPSTGGDGEGENDVQKRVNAATHSKVTRTVSCGTGIRSMRAGIGTSKVSAARALFEGKIDSASMPQPVSTKRHFSQSEKEEEMEKSSQQGKPQPASPKQHFSQSEKEEHPGKKDNSDPKPGKAQPTSSKQHSSQAEVCQKKGTFNVSQTTKAKSSDGDAGKKSNPTPTSSKFDPPHFSSSKPKTIDLSSNASQKKLISPTVASKTSGVISHSSSSPSPQTTSGVKASTPTTTANSPGGGSKILFSVRSRTSSSTMLQPNARREEVAAESSRPSSTEGQPGMAVSVRSSTSTSSVATPSVPSSTVKVFQTNMQSRNVHKAVSLAESNNHSKSHQQSQSPATQQAQSSSSSSSSSPFPLKSQSQGRVHTPLTKSFSYTPQVTVTDFSHTSSPQKTVSTQRSAPTITTEAPSAHSTALTTTTSRVVTFRQSPGKLAVASNKETRLATSLEDIPEQVAKDTPERPSSLTNSPVVLRTRRRPRADRPMSLNRAETVNLANMISRIQEQNRSGGAATEGGREKALLGLSAAKGLASGAAGNWRSGRPASYYGGDTSK